MTEAESSVPDEGFSLASKKIWLLGMNYAPDRVGIAPYSTQLAEHLSGKGARVEVTAGIPDYPDYQIRPEDRWTVSRRELINGIPVRRLRHTVPRRMTAARRTLHEASFLAHLLARRPPFRPDVIIGVTPPLSGSIAAAWYARRLGVPLVVIVQDLVGPGTYQSGIAGGKRVAGLAGALETWVMRQAAELTVLHDRFAPYALEAGVPKERVNVIRNWSFASAPKTSREEVRRELGWPLDCVVALYAGNMGLKMDLGNIVEAARYAENSGGGILFVLLGGGSQRRHLERQGAGIATLTFEDSRFGSAFTDTLAAADILLINERPSMDNMSLPSKLTYYFAAGRPIVAAVAAGGTTALEVELAGAGVVVRPGEPLKLLYETLKLAKDEVRCRSLGESARRYGAIAYDRDRILRRYEEIIARAKVC